MIGRAGPGAALLLALAATPVIAQEPADRARLDRFRDSLALSTDTTALLALERQWIDRARVERDDPMHHIRLGLIALRLAELRPNVAHLDHAIGEFEWAAELRPDWPWPWYGIGLAESRGRDRAGGFAGGLWTMIGQDRERLSGQAFARAVNADPMFVRGLIEFAKIALEQRIDAPVIPALEALRAATATPIGWDGELLVARGRLERLAGFADSAALAFRRAVLVSLEPALAQLELARTIPLLDTLDEATRRDQTMRAYLGSLERATPDVIARIRRDLEPLTTRGELRRFDELEGQGRIDWLMEFWSTRDAVDLREPGSRLAEHYRRWNVAVREFRLPPFRRRYRFGIELFRSGEVELDDRGVVYIRQGDPTLRIVWPAARGQNRIDPLRRNYGNESWRYDRPDGPLTLHFVARDDPNDFRLVDSPLELDVALDQLERHAHEFPGLARMLRAGTNTADWVGEEVRREVRASMALATRTDSWQRQYRDILSGRAQWLAVGVRDGQPLVHIVYALDAESVRSARLADAATVPVRVMASFVDRQGRAVAQLDTVHALPVPGPGANLVAARAEVPVPPGNVLVRLGVEIDSEHGMLYPIDSLVIPRPDAASPELSAMLIGRPGRSLSWVATPVDTAWLDAGGIYSSNDTIAVYAEAYGLAPGREATMRLAVTRRRGGIARLLGRDARALEITERFMVGAPMTVFRRDLALGGLEPGQYALRLTLESGGTTVERNRGLAVR